MESSAAEPVPRVSIVVPYHNEPSEYLRDALSSLGAQTLGEWEVIVVDDGSPEPGAGEVIQELGDPRFRLVRHRRNRGLGAARNTGFRAARAPVVASLDADDRLHPEFLGTMLGALDEHPEADWAWTDLQLFGESDEVWRFPRPLPDLCPAHLNYRGGSSVIRRSLWGSLGGFVEDPLLSGLEDLDFWLGALQLGATPIHVSKPLYQWRIRRDSMTAGTSVYDSHLKLGAIYRRRRSVFTDRRHSCAECRGRNPGAVFMAVGYFNSSVAALKKGERAKAVRMAARGWMLRPGTGIMIKQLLRALLPRWAFGLVRRVRSAIASAGPSRRGSSRDSST
jgi:glycosyltransferase involved in cell wall biosynthesis